MKLILSFLFLVMTNVAHSSLISIPLAKDNNNFHPLLNNILYIRNLHFSKEEVQRFKVEGSEFLLRVPTSYLNGKWPLKENQSLFVHSFSDLKSYKFIVPSMVYLYFYGERPSRLSNVSLLLIQDKKELSSIKPETLTGVVYSGIDRVNKTVKEQFFTANDTDLKKMKITNPDLQFLKDYHLKQATVFDYKMIIYGIAKLKNNDFALSRFLFQKGESFYVYPTDSLLLNSNNKKALGYSIFENTVAFRIFEDPEGIGSTDYLVLCSKGKIEIVEIGGPFNSTNIE